jgi:hypothetical protein
MTSPVWNVKSCATQSPSFGAGYSAATATNGTRQKTSARNHMTASRQAAFLMRFA